MTKFVVMLPDEGRSLDQLERDVWSRDMNSIMSRISRNSHFKVFLPKFRVELGMDLKQTFMKVRIPFTYIYT
jgi:serine protease inhibitor